MRILILTLLCSTLISAKAQDSIRTFIFGHSLINHEYQVNVTPSNETSVPHWMHFLAEAGGKHIAVSGQYGFLPQHDNLPPIAQWGFDEVDGVWDSDNEPFSAAEFHNILITPGNFIQYQSPSSAYWDDPNTSPISATKTIFSWCNEQTENLDFYIYENWPDMGSYLSNGFPPTASEWQAYTDYTQGGFHDWFVEYHDSLVEAFPNSCVKMIPIGPIISKLLSTSPYNTIAVDTLYEDDAPHGRPTIYFLAALTTYMTYYGEKAPSRYAPPTEFIAPEIADNYLAVVDFIWNELQAFNNANDESKVFCEEPITNSITHVSSAELTVYPNPTTGIVHLPNHQISKVTVSHTNGQVALQSTSNTIDIGHLPNGVYIISIIDDNGLQKRVRVVKH